MGHQVGVRLYTEGHTHPRADCRACCEDQRRPPLIEAGPIWLSVTCVFAWPRSLPVNKREMLRHIKPDNSKRDPSAFRAFRDAVLERARLDIPPGGEMTIPANMLGAALAGFWCSEWPTLDALMAMLLEAGYRATISTSRGGYWASVERIDDPEPLDARHFASSARRALLRASDAALRGVS